MPPPPFLVCESRISLTARRGRKILGDVRSKSAITKCGQVAALIAAGLAFGPTIATACKLTVKPETVRRIAAERATREAALASPVILDAGFEPPDQEGGHAVPGRLWIRLDRERAAGTRYILEPVAGHAPHGLPWGTAFAADGTHLVIPLDSAAAPGGLDPFVFGFRLRTAVPGHLGPASDPVWISFSTTERIAERAAPRSDQVLFVLLVFGL